MKLHCRIIIVIICLLFLSTVVIAGDLTQIYICPGDMMLRAGMQQQFDVFGLDAAGNHVPVTGAVTWSADSEAGTITSSGLFTAGMTKGMYPSGVKAKVGTLTAVAVVEVIRPAVSNDYTLEAKWGSYGPGHLNGPTGIAVKSTGIFYVGDRQNGRIQVFTNAGKYVTAWCIDGAGTSHSDYYWFPMAIALDSAGNVYETDLDSHCIKKYSPTGMFLLQFSKWDYLDEYCLFGAVDVAVDKNGCVYGLDSQKYQILKFDALGNPITRWGSEGTAAEQFTTPCALATDGTSRIYVVDMGQNAVKIFDMAGAYIGQWNGSGLFSKPWGIDVDKTGNVYVADTYYGGNRVRKFDPQGNRLKTWFPTAKSIRGVTIFYEPPVLQGNISVDADGNIYIARYDTNCVEKISASGGTAALWGRQSNLKGVLNKPVAIATDAQNNIYITDQLNHRVQKFDLQRRFVAEIGSDSLSDPYGLAVGPDGLLYVADRGRPYVQAFDQSGQCVKTIGSSLYLNKPNAVAVDSVGNVYVGDIGRGCVVKFGPQGQLLVANEAQYSLDPALVSAGAIAVDAGDCLYVPQHDDHMVVKYDPDGRPLMCFGEVETAGSRAYYAYGIDFDDKGNIYVATAFDVNIFDPSGKYIGKLPWPDGEYVANPLSFGIALDSFNNIYTVDRRDYHISKFVPRITPATPVNMKLLPEGQFISVSQYITTAGTVDMGDCFYIESPDRACGIKVVDSVAPSGKYVNVEGVISTQNGEMVIKATSVSAAGDASVQPIGANASAVGGSKLGFQDGLMALKSTQLEQELLPMSGLNNVGLLIRTWGRVKSVDTSAFNFTISGGSGFDLKCRAPQSAILPAVGSYVCVTGISAVEKDAQGNLLPILRVRRASDIQPQQTD